MRLLSRTFRRAEGGVERRAPSRRVTPAQPWPSGSTTVAGVSLSAAERSEPGDVPGTLNRTYPVARKAHRCSSCGYLIEKGERYHRWTGRSDMWVGLATAIECADCCERYGRPVPAVATERSEEGNTDGN